jgi:hypothetical protein
MNLRAILPWSAMGLLVYAFSSGFGGLLESAAAQTKEPIAAKAKDDGKAAPKIAILPPPEDVNDLSMEVAALRTLYLLKAGSDQNPEHNAYDGIKLYIKECAPNPPKKRRAVEVNKNYQKLLIELRAAFIVNNEDRISELSDQLDELTTNDPQDLDDAIEITEKSRVHGPNVLKGYFEPNCIASYVAAYGKDFPDPRYLMLKNTRDTAGKWPAKPVWDVTRQFIMDEVSWAYAGVNVKQQQVIADKVAKVLDRAYGMSKGS